MKQAIRIRYLTHKSLDRIVQRLAGARQDSKTGRWYLKISEYNLKEIRAKYWTSPREALTQEAIEEDKIDDGFQGMLNAIIESKVTSKVVQEMQNFKEQVLDEFESKLAKAEQERKNDHHSLVNLMKSLRDEIVKS